MSNKTFSIALLGTFDVDNYGDLLFPAIFRQQMGRRLPGAEVTLFSPTAVPGSSALGNWPLHAIHQLHECFPDGPDALVIGGGDLLRFDSGREAFPAHERGDSPYQALWLQPVLRNSAGNFPILWNAIGAPFPFTAEQASLLRAACARTDYLAVRDSFSLDALREAGVTAPIALVPDSCVLIRELFGETELRETWRALMGAAPRRELPTLCLQASAPLPKDRLVELTNQVRRLLGGHFRRVLLLPICNWLNDGEALAEIRTRLGPDAILIEGPTTSLQVAAAIWGSDAFVGTSLHGCLTALSFHKPHVGLGVLSKLRGYAALIGSPQAALSSWSDLAAASSLLLPRNVSELAGVHRRLCARAEEHFDHLAEFIRQGRTRMRHQTLAFPGQTAAPACPEEEGASADPASLRADLAEARAQLQTLRASEGRNQLIQEHYRKYYAQLRFRLVEKMYRALKRWPVALPALHDLVAMGQAVFDRLRPARAIFAPGRWMDRLLFLDPPFYWLCKSEVRKALQEYLTRELAELVRGPASADASSWFRDYRPTPDLLARFRARRWPSHAPVFTIVMRPRACRATWLTESWRSVVAQTYSRWRLVFPCGRGWKIVESSERGAVDLERLGRFFADFPAALAEAGGDFICWMEQGDLLEPHALHRLADAAVTCFPDLIYSDEVRTGADPDCILAVEARPAFSHDHYLSHPYFDHLVGLRAKTLRETGAAANVANPAQDVDTILRVLEQARTVTHIPDILYRQRASAVTEGKTIRAAVLERHLGRLGYPAEVLPTDEPACLDVRPRRVSSSRVAIIIPTKNHHELLRRCVESLERTESLVSADLFLIDHESDEPASMACLKELKDRHAVLPYEGEFNFSAMMNDAVSRLPECYTHYLFLNNDVEAISPGWLEHMTRLGQRNDVGIVGALLLYPDGRVQHGGTVVGLHYGADHGFRYEAAHRSDGRRAAGPGMGLIATREQTAVTGACLLIGAEVFHQVGGFDVAFAVGFGDTDLCLRVRARGKKVILDAQAMLYHHESATRGRLAVDPHPLDTQLFRARYLQLILSGEDFYSPLLSRQAAHELNPYARAVDRIVARSTPVVLPRIASLRIGNAISRAAA